MKMPKTITIRNQTSAQYVTLFAKYYNTTYVYDAVKKVYIVDVNEQMFTDLLECPDDIGYTCEYLASNYGICISASDIKINKQK